MTPQDRRQRVEERLADDNPDALYLDGLDSALVGVVTRCGQPSLVCYSEARILAELHRQNPAWTRDDGLDWLAHNIAGAWAGEHTPMILEWVGEA